MLAYMHTVDQESMGRARALGTCLPHCPRAWISVLQIMTLRNLDEEIKFIVKTQAGEMIPKETHI